jgi:hypothetical protein
VVAMEQGVLGGGCRTQLPIVWVRSRRTEDTALRVTRKRSDNECDGYNLRLYG